MTSTAAAPRLQTGRSIRARTLLLVCLVAGVAVTVHARVLWYPFIQDDWGYLFRALTTDPLDLLRQELVPFARELYRPIWPFYFPAVGKVFALNPITTHVITLTLHVASSLMVVRVLGRITGDPLIGWLSGVLYGSASLVHMDPLLWAAGIFESGSMFLALVSVWCVLQGHTWRAAIAYAGGLLFKESVAFLPVLFVGIALYERIPIRRFIPIGFVMAAYAGIKLAGPSALLLAQDHPYAVRLTGLHVLHNFVMYCRWSVGALFPSRLIPPVEAAGLLAGLGAVLIVGRLAQRRSRAEARGAILLAIWLLGAVSIYLVLPNHRYRYYLTPALPAVIGLILLSLRAGFDLLRVPQRAAVVIMIVLTLERRVVLRVLPSDRPTGTLLVLK